MRKGKMLVLVSLVACYAVLTGCLGKWTGGGWIVSGSGSGKATFGVNYLCTENNQNGHLQYVDHSPGLPGVNQVRFHANFLFEGDCVGPGEPIPPVLQAIGVYEPQPRKRGEGGLLFLTLTDGGEPGAGDDTFDLLLVDGLYDGYMNSGSLSGGNIQHHPLN
jgi:hypothetical protein